MVTSVTKGGHRNWQNIRLSKHTDMAIHWKALEEHFLMVPSSLRSTFGSLHIRHWGRRPRWTWRSCWAHLLIPKVVWRVLLLRAKRDLCVLHSGQSSRTYSGVWSASWHAHLADSIWFIRLRCALGLQWPVPNLFLGEAWQILGVPNWGMMPRRSKVALI
jgi:hypothetical protein